MDGWYIYKPKRKTLYKYKKRVTAGNDPDLLNSAGVSINSYVRVYSTDCLRIFPFQMPVVKGEASLQTWQGIFLHLTLIMMAYTITTLTPSGSLLLLMALLSISTSSTYTYTVVWTPAGMIRWRFVIQQKLCTTYIQQNFLKISKKWIQKVVSRPPLHNLKGSFHIVLFSVFYTEGGYYTRAIDTRRFRCITTYLSGKTRYLQ